MKGSEYRSRYPEHAKMERIANESNAIGEFLEWLNANQGIVLARLKGRKLYYLSYTLENLLALHFGIDLIKVEQEKRKMLEEIRSK